MSTRGAREVKTAPACFRTHIFQQTQLFLGKATRENPESQNQSFRHQLDTGFLGSSRNLVRYSFFRLAKLQIISRAPLRHLSTNGLDIASGLPTSSEVALLEPNVIALLEEN